MAGIAGLGNGEKECFPSGSWQGKRMADYRFDDISATQEPMSRRFSPGGRNRTVIENCRQQHRFAA